MSVDPAETSGDPRVAIEQVQLADQRWSDALEASVEAPPDLGFAQRVRAIANAAEQEAAALRHADLLGLAHRPHPGARNMQLSHELRPGARSRRGPQELWEQFDAAVAELGEALEGVALSAIASAFAELSEIARELAREIERIDSQQRRPPPRGLNRRARIERTASARAPLAPAKRARSGVRPLALTDLFLAERLPGSGASWARWGSPASASWAWRARRTARGRPGRGHARRRSARAIRSPSRRRAPTLPPTCRPRPDGARAAAAADVNGWQIAGCTCPG